MYQLPARAWNDIAELGATVSEWGQIMALPQEEMDKALSKKAREIRRKGLSGLALVAYMKIAPLLAERKAIAEAKLALKMSEMEAAIPEVLTPAEAIELMEMETNGLSETERRRAARLLNAIQ
ncbi:hypothetical protein [Microbulbifer thermotolerans]|uniref:hypothetical protein n=1 Tax=Microbulbifer thermotolerans TaxID=252514 RepID=UPI002248851E|nr:hypothetical protein [Microbulbifer thermotolerans]MCX2830815.1 hypothetical protein [Microbulbifer thermotolerans]